MAIKTVEESWKIIESWLKEMAKSDGNYSKVLDALNPPATDEQIKDLEQKLNGIELPKSYIQALKTHNGIANETSFFNSGVSFLPIEDVNVQWKIWWDLLQDGTFDDMDDSGVHIEGVQPVWYDAKWIPFTHNGGGDHLCIDLNPTKDGQIGQIIEMWHDDGDRSKLALSFEEYFSKFADELVGGKYSVDEYGLIHEDD
ncbi:hypothetical protein DASC09_053570 [Saccharomycopsis crataegensis]|uniref:Knr4/Smi1-like domain-containing protein n=1 Tax=Saccharomycopsis crataegensis TaxID=43959 RepID=A0AAV5QUF6_9ASCO|nr:hypothetical protein DASC09_053570 [Saccharomycopsis crataegensis]